MTARRMRKGPYRDSRGWPYRVELVEHHSLGRMEIGGRTFDRNGAVVGFSTVRGFDEETGLVPDAAPPRGL